MKKRKSRSDSATEAVGAFASAGAEISLPEGVVLRSEEEHTIWKQFTRARASDAWRDFDLVLLAKVVRLEADIRAYQCRLDDEGPIVENKRGTQIDNPLFRVVDQLQRQQLSIIRSMSLTSTGRDPRTVNDAGRIEEQTDKKREKMETEDLLAGPMH